jgi:glycosyltransferase involved in cell wall biosynthesis
LDVIERRVRAVVFLHVPDSTLGAVRMGYGRLREVMAARGDTLDIITPNQFPSLLRVHGRWIVLLYPFAVAWRLWQLRGRYDVALFHSYAGWVAHLFGVAPRAITVFHGVEPLHVRDLVARHRTHGPRVSKRFRLVHGWLMDRALRLSCRRSDRVTCLNTEEYAFLADGGWATTGQLVLLRHGVPDQFFVDQRRYAPKARRVLFVSQWIERKGVAELVEGFTAARRSAPDLELWCVGTRATDATVLRAFPPESRAGVVHRPEVTQDELAAIGRDADVFVHLAATEAYGRAIAEAMAGGLPIICTPVGVARDLLRDGESVLTVPARNPAAVAAAIGRLVGDAGLRARLGCGAHAAAAALRASERDGVVADLISSVVATAA